MGTTAAGAPCDTTFACSDSFPCPLPRPPSPSLLPHALHAAAVLFVLVEPASPPAVELLAEAFVRFLALCPPWLSVVRNLLLSLGNHLPFCQHPQCSAIHCVQPNSPLGVSAPSEGFQQDQATTNNEGSNHTLSLPLE